MSNKGGEVVSWSILASLNNFDVNKENNVQFQMSHSVNRVYKQGNVEM